MAFGNRKKEGKKTKKEGACSLREFAGTAMAFALLPAGEKALWGVLYWLEEVRQDVCNMQGDIVVLREELDKTRAEVARLRERERVRELAAQTALLREARESQARLGETRTRLPHFERLVPGAME
jgi:hypothetical protein